MPTADDARTVRLHAQLLRKMRAIEAGGDINAANKKGQTALMIAAYLNHRLAIAWLVAKGADVNALSKEGRTARQYTSCLPARELLRLTAAETRPPSQEEMSRCFSTVPDAIEARKMLPQAVSRVEKLSLLLARAGKMSAEELNELLPSEGEPTELSPESLALLVRRGLEIKPGTVLPTRDLTKGEAAETQQLLMALGAATTATSTPPAQLLAAALLRGDHAAARNLVSEHPELLHERGIMRAVRTDADLQTLISAGLDPTETWERPSSAGTDTLTWLHEAVHTNPEVVLSLLQAGCPLPSYANDENILHELLRDERTSDSPEVQQMVASLVNAGADPHACSPSGQTTPLQLALRARNLAAITALSDGAVDIDEEDSPLHELFSPAQPQSHELPAAVGERDARSCRIPAIISLLRERHVPVNHRAWQAFLSVYLDTPRSSPDLMEPAQETDEKILNALLDAAGGTAPPDAASMLPLYPSFLPGEQESHLMKRLLQCGALPHSVCSEGKPRTPLCVAAAVGDDMLVRMLIAAGADVNAAIPGDHLTPLHYAAHPRIVRTLLIAGANISDADRKRPLLRYTLSHFYRGKDSLELCRMWMQLGAHFSPDDLTWVHPKYSDADFLSFLRLAAKEREVNIRGSFGRLLLQRYEHSPERLSTLLRAGADPRSKDSDGRSLLHIMTDPMALQLLVEAGADINARDAKGATPLHEAVNHPARTEKLLSLGANVDARDAQGRTALHLTSNVDCLRLLLNAKASPDARDKEGKTPIHLTRDAQIAGLLVQNGANVDAMDDNGATPLRLSLDDPERVELLLRLGAKPNMRQEGGRTLLHIADNPDVIRLLLAAGADYTARDQLGRTPLHEAGHNPAKASALISAGAPVNAPDKMGMTPLMLCAADDQNTDMSTEELLLQAQADTDIEDYQGRTALEIAQEKPAERAAILRFFAENGVTEVPVNPRARDTLGRTALMHAVLKKHPNANRIRKLIEQGAEINARDKRGWTPLMHLVAAGDHPGIIALLLDNGAIPNLVNFARKNAAIIALENNHPTSYAFISEYYVKKFEEVVNSYLPQVHLSPDYLTFRNRDDYRRTSDVWSDPAVMKSPGPRLVVISLSSQRGMLVIDQTLAMDFPVCTGRGPQHLTPTGFFRIINKDERHRSNIYGTSMPFFMRLTMDGVGLHVGEVLRHPDSHGCIRLPYDPCAMLFQMLPVGSNVVIHE